MQLWIEKRSGKKLKSSGILRRSFAMPLTVDHASSMEPREVKDISTLTIAERRHYGYKGLFVGYITGYKAVYVARQVEQTERTELRG